MPSTPEPVSLDPAAARAAIEEIDAVAQAAFGALDGFHAAGVERLRPQWEHDSRVDGFRCWVVPAAGSLAGFAAGYVTPDPLPAGDWFTTLAESLDDGALPLVAGQLALVWLSVRPEWQGHGLGSALTEAFLEAPSTSHAWLVASPGAGGPERWYRRRGWDPIGRGPLGGGDRDRLVLGRDLRRAPPPTSVS